MIQSKIAMIAVSLVILFISNASCGEKRSNYQKKWLSDIRLGILAHDVSIWSHTSKEGGADFNTEFVFNWPHYALLRGIVRSNIGVSLNNPGGTSKIYSGVLWEYKWQSGIFVNLGLGLSLHDGELESNDDDMKELGYNIREDPGDDDVWYFPAAKEA